MQVIILEYVVPRVLEYRDDAVIKQEEDLAVRTRHVNQQTREGEKLEERL
jgi:hypothetical protein